jgi:hypothetical protein
MPLKPPPANPIHHPDLGPELERMRPLAIACIRETLERKRGDRVAVDLAKWVVDCVAQGKRGEVAREEDADFGKALRMLKGGRG